MLKKISAGSVILLIGAALFLFNILHHPPAPVPEIGRNLPGNFEEADQEFQRRVAKRFSLPMATTDLIDVLRGQGFKVADDAPRSVFTKSGFPCELNWHISWTDHDGKVIAISSRYGAVCI